MLERPAPCRAAVRQRRARERRRRGLASYRVELPEYETIEALIRARRLSEQEALSKTAVERALAEVLADWARRWLK
jgi:hypothetical protein